MSTSGTLETSPIKKKKKYTPEESELVDEQILSKVSCPLQLCKCFLKQDSGHATPKCDTLA